jgi:hypothetical protein
MAPIRCLLLLACLLVYVWQAHAADTPAEQTMAILEKATQFDLYSLEPATEGKVEKNKKTFHGWEVLGKTTVKDGKTRKELLDALQKKGDVAKCFDPRHGIRASHGGKSVDLVICFRCGQIYVFPDGKGERAATLTISDTSQPVFDRVLKAAKVPLAKKRG